MELKPTIKIDFCDFQGIDKTDNYFTRLLSRRYRVIISDKPDLLIYCNMGHMHRLYNCKKLFWTSESLQPDYTHCDYAMTCFHNRDPRHFRLPFYVMTTPADTLIKSHDEAERIMRSPRKFCSFVVSNANPRRTGKRIGFFQRLNSHKRVDSGGRAFNNIGRELPFTEDAIMEFLAGYKFNICFENKLLAGYTTEKLPQAMRARCIPLYWGDPLVANDFNPRSFLSLSDFADEEAFIARILEIDRDDNEYFKLLQEPYFHNNTPNEYYDETRILDFFDTIFADTRKPVSRRRNFWHPWRLHLVKGMK